MPACILIIEDNPENLELMRYILEMHGHRIIPAETGEDGLIAMREQLPDLVICDIQLPGLNGYDFIEVVKNDTALCSIPVIAVTAYAMVGDREKILAAGFDSYIPKPIMTELFTRQIEVHLPTELCTRDSLITGPQPQNDNKKKNAQKSTMILVVDNLQMNLDLAINLLGQSGYNVMTATGMYDALSQANLTRPALILSDVGMVEGSGYDLVRIIKSDKNLHHIPVILITSTLHSEMARKNGLAAGASRFLFRPIEPEALLQVIETCLEESGG